VISVVETSRLPVPPERVWRFFAEEVEDRYCDWHPEHLRWRWLSGRPLEPGSTWFADEFVGRARVSGRFVVAAVQPGRRFAYRLPFPGSLVRGSGSFELRPAPDGGCELVQAVRIGFSAPVLGALVDLAVRAAVPPSELRRHMREEQRNLPGLLE
jgi:uncharacterized protein YndB with AHSA1/START domain